ncbi:hypothetical protein [Reinekea marinisedimentorum]|uniref:Extracellular solute-binding protein (Family 3) n=1 Tax=Reinekea marinisedimentorum TaxID=230495 RepID=A0A4V2UJQ9_9GAMM|nr:hypothetical protein [Reinekea marinisedimentorum]TCS41136.1 hypothetical protein BCF53_107151 [Reinekea marinisedimentorum]
MEAVNTIKRLIYRCLIMAMASAALLASANEDVFRMHSGHDPDSPSAVWMELFYAEVFRRLDMPHEVLFLPNKRGAMMTETGEIDGQVNRVYAYQSRYPQQRRVNEPISRLSIIAWVRAESGLAFDSWQSFKDSGLRIDYVRGVVLAEIKLIPLIEAERLSTSSFSVDGLTRLKYDLSDVFVHSNFGVYPFLNDEDFAGYIRSGGVISSEFMYPYVHAKHAYLIPEMERVIREVKAEGLLLRFCFEAYGDLNVDFCRELQPD